ncbi:hypothetical protein ACKWTF_007362 [Chironomus riparius]
MNFGKTTSIIISGSAFFYLLAQSTKFISSRIKIERQLKSSDYSLTTSHCCICNSEKVDDTNVNFVTCKGCESLVCTKQSCSEHVTDLDIWECDRCRKNRIVQQKTGEWFLKQLKDFSAFNFEMALGENILNLQNENGNKVIISKVRGLIEKCLIKILNGTDLDATSIEQISESEEYLPNSSCINTDYVELKRFVNRVCQEVINISDTLEFSDASVPKSSFDPQTYEELLATAVLNKITTDFQHRKKYGMNSQLPAEKDTEIANDDEDIDFSNFYYDKMHLDKIQSHKISLPDLLNEFDTLNDEDYENGNHSGSWEGNWSLKRFPTANISMLIPEPKFGDEKPKIGEKDIDELSDSSNKDTNSEDLDAIYEDENEVEKHMSYIDSLEDNEEIFASILETADIKEELENFNDDQKSISKFDNSYDIELENEAIFNNISEIKGNIDEIFEQILGTESDSSNQKLQNESIEISTENVINKDNEQNTKIESPTIEESKAKYKSPLFSQYLIEPIQPIKISEALKNVPKIQEKITEASEIKENKTVAIANNLELENFTQPLSIMKPENLNIIKPKNDVEDNSPPIPGSIAEREHLKWLKAIPIENNPYSPEALHKRLSRTHDKHFDISSDKHADEVPSNNFDERQLTDDITKYKRDYYINQSSVSTESINMPKNESEENDVNYAAYNSLEQQNDSSLTTSDDSLTRIYTLSSQETVIIPSHKLEHESHENVEHEVKKFDIAEENILLPSVKKLAEFYASSTNLSEVNSKEPEEMNIPEGISKITSKKYATSDTPANPIASITARTLPPKIKEELRKSLHDDLTVIRHNERNVSPDIIQHGMAKNSIAYFENFYK